MPGRCLPHRFALILPVWVIRPLRHIWPWVLEVPPAIQIGIGAAALGLIVLMASLIALRFTTSQVMAGAAELLAYGTAVKIE